MPPAVRQLTPVTSREQLDHHCAFTGQCIGQRNHGHFLMFLAYLVAASVFMFVLCLLAYPRLRLDLRALTSAVADRKSHGDAGAVRDRALQPCTLLVRPLTWHPGPLHAGYPGGLVSG